MRLLLLSVGLFSLPTIILCRFLFPDKPAYLLLSVALCDVFYCPFLYSAVFCSRCIKNEKGRPRPKFRPFSSHQQLMGCHARKLLCISHRCYTAMIREKAIFIKLNQLHFSDQQLFDITVAGFKPSSCRCPKCGAVGQFSRIRPYRRFMISVDHGRRSDTELIVPRLRCDSCGGTHALLPDSLIPFGSYSLRFVLTILLAYLNRNGTVTGLCEHWGIAISTLYSWVHLFRTHYNAWCRVLDRIQWVTTDSLASVSDFAAFPSGFLARFGFSFLQGRRTSPSGPAPRIDRRRRTTVT